MLRSHNIMLALGLALALPGCGFPLIPRPLDKEQVVSALSTIMLAPHTTCDELRRQLGLEQLVPVSAPSELGYEFEEYKIATPDGQFLRVWRIPPYSANRGCVVLSIGATGSMACYLYTAKQLVDSGWTVFLYEYQGFGVSTGSASLTTLKGDLNTVLDWALAVSGENYVTLMGISLGAIPTVSVAIDRPEVVNAVVLDSPVALGEEIERWGVFVGNRTDEILALLDDELATERIISKLRKPLLILVGAEDVVAPPREAQLLFDRAAGPKLMVTFPGVNHALAVFLNTGYYQSELAGFLGALTPYGEWLWTPPAEAEPSAEISTSSANQ
jgi:uncharacterized protein